MKSVRSNNLSLKYKRFTLLGFKDMGIRKFKTERLFLSIISETAITIWREMKVFKIIKGGLGWCLITWVIDRRIYRF